MRSIVFRQGPYLPPEMYPPPYWRYQVTDPHYPGEADKNKLLATLFSMLFAVMPLAVLSADDLEEVRKSAAQGDSQSQFSMGQRYEAGKGGVERDLGKAAEWFRKAALQGYAKAQTNLGNFYRAGKGGIDKDYGEAMRWYRKAAGQDDTCLLYTSDAADELRSV